MSKGWATIVYGRTYHLDFRFISVPQDFTPEDLSWAAAHIIATTQQARNLAGSPRWSLFKNNSYGIVGVTCTIEDLIGDTVKDDCGRPLYAFVGYVTPLAPDRIISDLPPYADLANFKAPYQEIERVWSIEDYELDSRKPYPSQYQPLTFPDSTAQLPKNSPQLNTSARHPDKIYLWSNHLEQNSLLWRTSARVDAPVATCLNVKGKPLTNSPFLNQSNQQIEQFQILERVVSTGKYHPATSVKLGATKLSPTLSQKIGARARGDIELTLQQAAKVALAGQEIVDTFGDWHQPTTDNPARAENSNEDSEFGFKKKSSDDRSDVKPSDRDWF